MTFDIGNDGKHFYVYDNYGHVGMIDENGKTIIEPIYSDIGNYGEIIPVVVEEEDYNYRFVDTNGEYAFDRSFINAGSFINDKFQIMRSIYTVNKNIYPPNTSIRMLSKYLNYVIMHELSHLIHGNHSARFWNLVEENCPGAKKIGKEMKEFL